jgi:transposase InsO family protein
VLSVNERWLEILLTPMRDQITVAETCRRYGISRQSFYVYQRRLYADGVAALAPLSRRPLTSPAQTMPDLEAEIVRIRKANPRWGARTIHTHLVRSGAPHVPAVSTIHRVLQRNSLITPRAQRRAVPAWRRFERYAPNDLWQIDGTQVTLTDGSVAWVIDILDDHARFAIGATASRRFTATTAWRAMETAIAEHGAPRQLISDNGVQFISRDGHKPVHFQQRLAAMGIRQLSSRPAHPQTCGKLERYHRTFKDFYADHGPATTIDELQALCDRFRWHYNHQRPHQGLNHQLPAEVYQALPKVAPGDRRPRRRKTGPRVLIVSPQGSVHYRKRKIGIGMHWKGQQVTVIETTPDHVVVLDRTTGAVLRELTLGPVGTYHSNGRKRGRPRKDAQPPTTPLLSAMS